ncbi:MAG: ABC transporter ATP-binding protein [Crocinitomicaceae bacterium]|nr:ABC transporter ATP-binding protein/permease [Flavobacteriales bacterium]NQZ34170.1 ABC transporter ATP-binding protein [Crocinitomicaceae bacterium]
MARKRKSERVERPSKESIQKAKGIFKYMRPYRGLFMVGWIFLILSASAGMVFPFLMGQLLGSGASSTPSMADNVGAIDLNNVNTVVLALFILFAAQSIFSFFRVVIFTNVTENTLRDVRKDAFSRLVHMPMDFFNQNKVGELTSRVSADITQVQDTLRTTIAEFFRQIFTIVIGIIVLAVISWKLALIMLASVPVVAIVAVIFGRFIRKLSKEAQTETANSNSILEESLMGISNVKAFTNESLLVRRFTKTIDNIRRLNVKSGLWRGAFISFIIFCVFGAIVLVIWQGILMTQGPDPALNSKDFFSFIMYTIFMGASISAIPDMYASIQKTIGATENLMSIIHQDSEQELLTGELKPVISGRISFNNVQFSYPQRNDIEVLRGIDLHVEQNQTIALVGSSGAGKSTIASLLLNYYPITGGSIQFDDTKIEGIDVKHLREHIAIVPQEVLLFAGSIRENILFGRENATDEEIIDAAKQANAWEFIETFPEGLETAVGDRGIQLSGGQKQRIAIARAILKNPTILILDEATSALDSESEKLVQDALQKLMQGRTSIVIAHRLSTIRSADCIYVIEEGQIAESGRHDELISQQGVYSKLVQFQTVEQGV